MSETTIAAPEVATEGPDSTNLMAEALEATGTTASPEQTETVGATEGDNQGEQANAPESYELSAPEGVSIEQDSAIVAAYGDFAKSLSLPQDKAQEGFSQLATAQAAHAKAQHAALVQSWTSETRDDPVLGGANLNQSMVKADQFLATFDQGKELRSLLIETGLINHRAVIRALGAGRDAISDDQFVTGNLGGSKPRTAVDHFPNSPQLK